MLYLVIHEHRYGTDRYLVECDRVPTHCEVVTACHIDYEDDRDDEFIGWAQMPTSEIIKIP